MAKKSSAEKHQDSSREKLIRSAETLFAERGFDGVSVRDIAKAAGVNSGLIGYYFRSKKGLLSEVYRLHCEPLKRERERLLARFTESTSGFTLENVIEAFIRPSLAVSTDKNGRSGFTRLRAILSAENSALLDRLVAENFDASSRMFIEAIGRCLPELNRDDIFWRFHFLLGAIYYTGAGPNRIRTLSAGRCDPSNPDATAKHMIPFFAAGFRTLSTHMNSRLPARKSKAR